MANYNCILFDCDNTLLDFDAARNKALAQTLEQFGLPVDAQTQDVFLEIDRAAWKSFGRGEVKKERLVVDRFTRFLKRVGQQGNAVEMNRFYQDCLAVHSEVLPGALEMLQEVSEVATIVVISNGVEKVQRSRLKASGLERYLDAVFISERVGNSKPSGRFFEKVLSELGLENHSKVLVVGDDLDADIKGGNGAGLATCWVNFGLAETDEGAQPKYIITSFEQLYPIVMEPEELANVGVKNRRHSTDIV